MVSTRIEINKYYYEAARFTEQTETHWFNLPLKSDHRKWQVSNRHENEVIRVLKGFEQDFKKERPKNIRSFLSGSPDRNRTCIKSLGNFYSIH